jgi:hypothetical protein
MKQTLSAVLLVWSVLPPPVLAQQKPNISGTWRMDPSRSQSAVQNEPVTSLTLVINQGATELMVETRRDDRVQNVTYRPGTPHAMNSDASRTGPLASVWYVDGPRVITEMVSDVNGMTVQHRAIYTLEAGGAEMTVESLTVVEHGYSLRGAQNYGSGKDVFKKIAP